MEILMCVMYDYVYYRYVFGITHVPRLEDWPVMPVERIGFMLMVSTLHIQSHLTSNVLEYFLLTLKNMTLHYEA